LSREADLAKRDVSLSYAYLAGPDLADPGREELKVGQDSGARVAGQEAARIISSEFSVPTRDRGQMTGRYGCAAQGKLLILSVPGESGTRSGDLVPVHLAEPPWRDPKSRAVVAELHSTAGKGKTRADKPKPKQASSRAATEMDQKNGSRQRSSASSAPNSKKRPKSKPD
jgi:hypothetical protein